MQKEMFEAVLALSNVVEDVDWHLEQMLKILLKDTGANLEDLHEELRFFCIALHNCKNEWEKHKIAAAREIYLKNRYEIYFQNEE